MTIRMTGFSGLLDVDELVKANLEPYKLKVNTQKQTEQITEWKQEQYRSIMKSANALYTKYLTSDGSSSLISSNAYNAVKFTSSDNNAVTATTSPGASIDNYTVSVANLASKASTTLSLSEITALKNEKNAKMMHLKVGGVDLGTDFDISGADTADGAKAVVTQLNTQLSGKGFTAKYSEFNQGIVVEADNMNTSNSLEISFKDNLSGPISGNGTQSISDKVLTEYANPIRDIAANATIKNSKGEVNNYRGYSNEVTLDGVTFNFKDTTGATDDGTGNLIGGTPIKLTGGKDVTTLKDRIVSFVKDYNELMASINTKLYEKRDKSYTPLTDDQKKDMKDNDIKKWQDKAQTGLLRGDDRLEQLAEGMKSAMAGIFGNSLVSSSGLTLERIGIKPVQDYKEQNGLYNAPEEETLKSALENNLDGIKEMFMKNAGSDDTTNAGIIPKLAKVLYDNVKKPDSVFVKLAGNETGVSSLTSDLSKQITDMKKKIAEMEKSLTDRENMLYKKYASYEKALTSMQAQQNSFSSYFGGGSN